MAKKLNSMPNYQARMPKQPHDVSRSLAFTCPPAQISPVYYDMLHLGDELHFTPAMTVRMNPLTVATLGKIDVHLDTFFVPLSYMYTPVTSIFYQTDDLISSAIDKDDLIKTGFPKFNINQTLDNWTSNGTSTVQLQMGQVINNKPQEDTVDLPLDCFDCVGKSVFRLMDFLKLNPQRVLSRQYYSSPTSTPWFLCAYQAIYQDYFRNDDREPRNYHYNLDSYYTNGTFQEQCYSPNFDYFKSILQINYVSRYKDYFNAVKVSPIGSSVSMLDGNESWRLLSNVNSFLFNKEQVYGSTVEYLPLSVSGVPFDVSNTTVGMIAGSTSDPMGNTSLNAANIRQLFMVDKMLRVVGRADKNYESQFLAHYGIKIPHDVLHNITHIGHDMATLTPEPIISSADTFNSDTNQGSSLGEIGGQGFVRFAGKKRNFTAPCHGVFMVVAYIQPRERFFGGVDKLHDLSDPMSFWQPEYDRKGMQPIFAYESNGHNFGSSDRLGWQFAYEQFKRKYDTATLAFKPSTRDSVNQYNAWVIATNAYGHYYYNGLSFADAVIDLKIWNLLQAPTDLNNIMQVPYDTRWSDDYTWQNCFLIYHTDPFICDFYLENKKVNMMSEFGEPEL